MAGGAKCSDTTPLMVVRFRYVLILIVWLHALLLSTIKYYMVRI